jgi:hypothetical protein
MPVRRAIGHAWERWVSTLSSAEHKRSVENIHALRIATKRLRYQVELAREIGEPEAHDVLPWLETLQDRIGSWHDRHVLQQMTKGSGGHERSTSREAERVELTRVLAAARRGKGKEALERWIREPLHSKQLTGSRHRDN